MRVWLIHIGETLPIEPGKERKLRMALFAETLADLGHEIVWWASTFDHTYKKHIHDVETQIKLTANVTLYLLHGIGYRRNVSLLRLLDHYQLARHFQRAAPNLPAPDVILCTVPTVELAAAAVAFGRGRNIPVVVDVRDLWPDIENAIARPLRGLHTRTSS